MFRNLYVWMTNNKQQTTTLLYLQTLHRKVDSISHTYYIFEAPFLIMKKRIAFRKLGRTSSHRWAMLRNMVTSLIYHERIVTTVPKAKELARLADKVIGYAKKGKYSVFYNDY